MQLQRKVDFGIFVILALCTFTTFSGVSILKELRVTDRMIMGHQTVLQNAIELRLILRSYYRTLTIPDSSITEEVKKSQEDDLYALNKFLVSSPPNKIPPQITQSYSEVISNIELVIHKNNLGQSNRELKLQVDIALRSVDRLVLESTKLVSAEAASDMKFISLAQSAITAISLMTVAFMLFGVLWFRKIVWFRIKRLSEILNEIRLGNLKVRWQETKQDEIGTIGSTINCMAEELETLKKERYKFIESVVHDLRSPLSTAYMYCELAQRSDDLLEPEEQKQKLAQVMKQIEQVKRLSMDLQELGENELPLWSLQMEKFSLGNFISEEVEDFRLLYPQHKFNIEKIGKLPLVEADSNRIKQLLNNLVSNAIKYSPPQSSIDIGFGSSKEGEFFVEVKDQGTGIPDQFKSNIFQARVRLKLNKDQTPGLGMGLYIVQQIVSLHHGRINVFDRNGGGTIFRITLPIIQNPSVPAQKCIISSQESRHSTLLH